MPDPFGIPTRRDPTETVVRKGNRSAWALGALAAALVLGLAFYGINKNNTRTAVNPEATVGQRSAADPPATAAPGSSDRLPPSSTTGQGNAPARGTNSIGQQQPR